VAKRTLDLDAGAVGTLRRSVEEGSGPALPWRRRINNCILCLFGVSWPSGTVRSVPQVSALLV
jgi:hypothetical protein